MEAYEIVSGWLNDPEIFRVVKIGVVILFWMVVYQVVKAGRDPAPAGTFDNSAEAAAEAKADDKRSGEIIRNFIAKG